MPKKLEKRPYWFNVNEGIHIRLYIEKITVTISQSKKPICWAYGRYQPDKANSFRGGNYINFWHGSTKKFKHYLFHMQPILTSSLNKILKANHQKPMTDKLLRPFIHGEVTSIHYPLHFQAGILQSDQFGAVFTFDTYKLHKILKQQKKWDEFVASLPDPGQHPTHRPSDPQF